jgi:hypothetical protein
MAFSARFVVRPEAAVFQVAIKGPPPVQCIVNSLSKRFRGKRRHLQLFKSARDAIQNRPVALLPVSSSIETP